MDVVSTSTAESTTLEIPWNINSPSADPTVVGGGSEDIFQITVSLDGKEWVPLGTVSRGNWRDASFSLPLSSWNDLKHLQVSIRGLSSYERPEILLDGIRVNVEYQTPGIVQALFGSVPDSPPPQPLPSIETPEAKHSCMVQPFSKTLRPGDRTVFAVNLSPSDDNLPYQVALGDLPEGVQGTLSSPSGTTSTVNMNITLGASTTPGSFSSVIIYRETNASGTIVGTICQYNLIIGS